MKRNILLLLVLCLSYSTHAQVEPEVKPVQNTLITKISATWCINCGTWGWDAHENIIEENQENTIHFNAHNSGDLESEVAKAFSSNYGSIGQPQFFLNNENLSLFSSNEATKRAEIIATISANTLQTPIVGVASLHEITDGLLTVQSNVEFFQNVAGDYFLATYIIEDGVMNSQVGQSGIVSHKQVMRTALSENHFGDPLVNGVEAAMVQLFELPAEWVPENLEMVSIVWRKDGDKFVFVNGAVSSLKEESSTPDAETPVDTIPEEVPVAGEALDFPEFPWLEELIDPSNCCDNKGIIVYNSGIYQFVYIEGDASCSENMGTLYFQNGTFYCSDSPNMDCRSAYGLSEAVKSWDCTGNPATEEEQIEEEPIEEEEPVEEEEINEEPTTPDFEEYPWLKELIATDNCCNNQTITAYFSGIYTFIYIEKDSDCGDTASQLYFQNGTFYCSDTNGLNCREAYGLSADRSQVLWTCAN